MRILRPRSKLAAYKQTMIKYRSIDSIINELNELALSLDGPDPLIKWALRTAREVIDCEFLAVALVRYDTVLLNCASIYGKKKPVVSLFKKRVKKKVESLVRSSTNQGLIWVEADCFCLKKGGGEKKGSRINSFHIYPLKARGDSLGFITLGSSEKKAFARFKLNMFENFSDHLALGIKALLSRSLIVEQSLLLEEEKKKAEEAKRKFDVIIGGMREGLIITDRAKNIISINDAAAHMIELKNSGEGKFVHEFVVNELIGKDIGEGVLDKDIYLTRPERRVLHVTTTPMRDGKNKLVGRATLLIDITKEKEVERMKSDFVSAVSHELKTPLTSIREAVSIVSEEIAGPVNEKQKRCLDVAVSDVDRLTRMINDLLDISRIESGKVRMKRTLVHVSQVVEHVFKSLKPQAEKAHVSLVMEVPAGTLPIFADPDQMIQVVTNLVGNALKFTPAGGEIRIASCVLRIAQPDAIRMTHDARRMTDGNFVEISVKDTGPGISKIDQEKLFKRFSQLDTGPTRKAGGTGLGLAISKEIAQRHGGKMWLDSEEGKGSVFSFTIPVFTEESAYLDLIAQEIERVKELRSSLAMILIKPKNSADTSVLKEKCRNALRRKDDIVVEYKKKSVLVIAEANKGDAELIVGRIESDPGPKFDCDIFIYPEDGTKAEELWKKIVARGS